jgi:hypothetical protein
MGDIQMTTSIEHLDGPPQVLSYAGPATPARPWRPAFPWFAVASGLLAWVPIFLSIAFGATQALWIALSLGLIGLIVATISVIDPDDRSYRAHIAGGLALLSTLAGIFVAINALID